MVITKNYIAKGEGADRFEKIPVQIYETADEAVKAVAREIVDLVQTRAASSEKCVLGLATGVSPIKLYQELVRMHREEGVSFRNVVTFNLDEYLPMPKESEQSYHYFMHHHLFDHIDIDPKNIHIPDGTLEGDEEIEKFCEDYEKAIEAEGGIDLQVLGIGRTGHIGFNEPGSFITSATRKVYLNDLTIKDAIKDFGSRNLVPTKAITMGVGTIMKARRVILLAWGEKKASIIKATVEGRASDSVPATFLQMHPNVQFVIDESAATELTRADYPWLVSKVDWDKKLIRKAVLRLCQKLNKPILKVEDKDYQENGLNDLIEMFGSANKVNIEVFNDMQHTISGWPGGKPNADDSTRPERANPYPKRVLIFSPHPDDDVISMGGTLRRLCDQHHDVHVAYETSGNIAVGDEEVIRYCEYLRDVCEKYSPDSAVKDKANEIINYLRYEKVENGEPERKDVLFMKGTIRREEARHGCRYSGVKDDHVHFLDLPFYETGLVKKNDLSEADKDIVKALLLEIKPDQMFVAGDLADPHGTHKVCLDAVLAAIDEVKDEEWMKNCRVWMYRGAWAEWEMDHIEMAVPISPEELRFKRNAILKHQSQAESAPYLGDDERLFWQRAEDRNRATAELYRQLGLASYEAIEAFVQYIPLR